MTNSFLSKFRLLVLLASLASCNQPPNQDATTETAAELKPAAELTYFELWQLILEANDAMGVDVHGDELGTDGLSHLTLIKSGECASADCGEGVVLENQSESAIKAIVKFTFDIPGNPAKEMPRLYDIPANGSTSLGCSNFCYDGETYPVTATIISAGFVESTTSEI